MNRTLMGFSSLAVAATVTLLWPGQPAGAGTTTTLSGYSGSALASVVHIEVYEPVLPIPTTPQGDFSVGYAATNVDTGPTSRALASYLWPGATIGDGFDQLTGSPGAKYPVQVNSRYPATTDSPAHNTAQLTKGNGMTTASDGLDTDATVTGLGIGSKDVDLLSGIGQGLGSLLNPKQPKPITVPDLPVPVSGVLAQIVSVKGLTSDSHVVVSDKKVTTTAHASASEIDILGGVIAIKGISSTTTIVSDGTKATVSGGSTIGGISLAGTALGLSDKGISIGTSQITLPAVPAALTSILKSLGVSFDLAPVTKKVDGPSGTFSGQAMTVTVDLAPLKKILNGPLSAVINLLGASAKTQLAPLLKLQPKIVLKLGDVTAQATASPAYDPGSFPSTGDGSTGGGTVSGSGGGITGGPLGGGSSGGDGLTGGGDTGGGGAVVAAPGPSGGGDALAVQPVSQTLPGLGSTPRALLLGALVLAGLVGWLMRMFGGALLGGGPNCNYGLRTGLPDLRKG